ERIGDGWECKGIVWKVTSANTNAGKNAARLEVAVDWNTIWKGDSITFVKENTVITVYKTTSDYREMDFDISLTANGHDVWIGGSEDHKGYSGFSARTILPDDIKFRSVNGDLTPTDPAMQVGGWVDMIATFGKTNSGFTMMADTTQMTSWHGWILRNKKSMQNAAFPGRKLFKIANGETVTMRYKLIIHKAEWPQNAIEEKFKTFIDKK
ncbi:MAG: PmoA family protein, partial [Imperialibacter sp.]